MKPQKRKWLPSCGGGTTHNIVGALCALLLFFKCNTTICLY